MPAFYDALRQITFAATIVILHSVLFGVSCGSFGINSMSRRAANFRMATSTPVKKTAEDELLESFGELIDSAAGKMPHKQFMKTAEKAKTSLDRAIAAHSRPRDTA